MMINLASIIDAVETHYRAPLSGCPVWIGVCDQTYFVYCQTRASVKIVRALFANYENVEVRYAGKAKAQ